MKKILIAGFGFLLATPFAFGKIVGKDSVYKFENKKYGKVVITSEWDGEPVISPVYVSVDVECKNRKKRLRPKKLALKDLAVCTYNGYDHDFKNNKVIIRYSAGSAPDGRVKCNIKKTKIISMKEYCQ